MGHEFWWSCSTKLMRSVFGNGLFDVVVVLILNFWVVATVVVPNNQRMIMGLPMGLKLEHLTGIILCLLSWYSNGICQLLFKNDKIASNGTRETASRITKEQKTWEFPLKNWVHFWVLLPSLLFNVYMFFNDVVFKHLCTELRSKLGGIHKVRKQ